MNFNFKKVSLILAFLSPAFLMAQEILVMEGSYQSRNIFVNNQIGQDGVGFCVTNVYVNGEVSTDEINQSAFEIDLTLFNLSYGDPVNVEIHHKNGCKPEVINPMALQPQATFKVENIAIDDSGRLNWSTSNESGSLPFKVQQFKWNKWVVVGEVQGEGSPGKHDYEFQTVAVSGENRFRVIQKSGDGRVKVSDEVKFASSQEAVAFTFDKKTKRVDFSSQTNFEVYDEYGQIISRGYQASIDMAEYSKGIYYVNYDNTFAEIER